MHADPHSTPAASRTLRGWRSLAALLGGAMALGLASQPAQAQVAGTAEPPARVIDDDPINPMQVPEAVRGLAQENRLGSTVPLDLPFVDSRGTRVTLGTYFGQAPGTPEAFVNHKPVVLLLVYFRCPLQCQGMMHRLYAKLNELDLNPGEKYTLLVVSFDPSEGPKQAAHEKAVALGAFKRALPASASASIEFLTDSGTSAKRLADAVGFPYRFLPESGEFAHGTALTILSPKGVVSRTLTGLEFPVSTLRFSLLEASDGKIGTSVDRIVSWCFHFDPNANAYVVQAFRVMQVGAVAGAAGLGGLMLLLVWRERLRRAKLAREAFARLNGPTVVTIDTHARPRAAPVAASP